MPFGQWHRLLWIKERWDSIVEEERSLDEAACVPSLNVARTGCMMMYRLSVP